MTAWGRIGFTPRAAAQSAAIAIALVLLALGTYTVTMDRRSSEATSDAERSILIARQYAEVSSMLIALERDATTFMFQPAADGRLHFEESVSQLLARLQEIRRIGTPDDVVVVDAILAEYLPKLAVVQDFFDALVLGQPYFGEMADEETVAALYAALEVPALAREQESLAAMRDLRAHQQQRVLTTSGVFAGGVALIVVLLLVLRSSAAQMAKADAALVQLRHESSTDSLTGLGNHRAFQEALRARGGEEGALVLVDLDRFKEANDLRGHAEGDQILKSLGRLLRDTFPERAYRIGGDEFAAIALSSDEASEGTTRVVRLVRERIHGVTASAGLTTWDGGALDASLVFAQADAALRWAKREGRNHWVRYDDVADRVGGVPSARKSEAVRRMIEDPSIVTMAFQPIWAMDGELRAAEALARLGPNAGISGPEEAFDVATQDGRSLDLDRICFEAAMRGSRGLPLSARLFVNMSPSALIDQRFTPRTFVDLAEAHGRTPSSIVVEITERATVSVEVLGERIQALREAGFSIALDDVGAGNAGLETLRRVPVDWIKIDRSIVQAAPADAVARGMMRALVAFAGEAGATVVTEGIETAEELGVVRAVMGQSSTVHAEVLTQGYYLGRPDAGTRFATPQAFEGDAAA